jgi:hypothetical protein
MADGWSRDEVQIFLTYLIFPASLGPDFTQPLTEMSARNRKQFLGSRERPARNANSITAICEPIV